MLRPGYFIADYISGKRQVSFPPVKMLFFVTVIILLIENIFGVTQAETEIDISDDSISIFNITVITINWLKDNPAWATLIMLSFSIVPTYLICRESPRCNRHTLPESFFIQVFIGVQMNVWRLLTNVLPKGHVASIALILLIMLGLVWFRTYYQLFGYSVWGTLWRLMAVWWNGLILIFTAAFIEIVIDRIRVRQLELTGEKIGNIIIGGLFMAAMAGTGLLIAWYIDHRRAKRAGDLVPDIDRGMRRDKPGDHLEHRKAVDELALLRPSPLRERIVRHGDYRIPSADDEERYPEELPEKQREPPHRPPSPAFAKKS
jgi:hypothetical protein